ncbi:MAG: Ku protein [Phycisphaeraceae bacterium]
MPRAMWSGNIAFGLVSIPVKLVAAARDRSIHFHMLSEDGQCRLRRKLYCPETGKEYDFKHTAKGYEIAPDQYVLIQNDEIDKIKPDAGRQIEISDFVDLESIDPLYYERPYYLVPDEAGAKAYRLLMEAMTRSGRVGIARFVMRQKQYLAALRAKGEVLMLQTMRYADEVVTEQELDNVPGPMPLDPRELDVAQRLIDALVTDFEPERYRDEYRERVEELVKAKAEGGTISVSAAEEPAPRVINLMDALQRSLDEARKEEEQPPAKKTKGTPSKRGGGGRRKRSA